MINQGKNDKMKLYVVCSLICIMIHQGVFLLFLNIFTLWLVSWWSAKAKYQDGAIWRMLLGLYHNDQPRTNFLLLNISVLWLVSRWSAKAKYQDEDIWGIHLGLYHNDQPRVNFPLLNLFALWLVSWWSAKAKMSRWKYVRYVPWFVSRWSTKDKFSFPEHNCTLARIAMISQGKMSRWGHMGMLLSLYHNDRPRRKMNMMRDIGRSKKIRGRSWFPPCLPFSSSWPDDGLAAAAAAYMWMRAAAAAPQH